MSQISGHFYSHKRSEAGSQKITLKLFSLHLLPWRPTKDCPRQNSICVLLIFPSGFSTSSKACMSSSSKWQCSHWRCRLHSRNRAFAVRPSTRMSVPCSKKCSMRRMSADIGSRSVVRVDMPWTSPVTLTLCSRRTKMHKHNFFHLEPPHCWYLESNPSSDNITSLTQSLHHLIYYEVFTAAEILTLHISCGFSYLFFLTPRMACLRPFVPACWTPPGAQPEPSIHE